MNTFQVINKSKRTVYRGGYYFLPLQTVTLSLNEKQRFFLNASSHLIVKKAEAEQEVHTQSQDEENNLICEYCGKEYKTTRGLENHLKKEHSEVIKNA
ncbi:hypothetical protein [Virgibacillus sp. SK37]|uniref:hypothetical protein n=1 Tax=Virgibacillus sp. SK37 TaxID=403957 RepID=UPI0004D1CA5A|nr:hypothetical protein [Virgibacillus sp. SK37]AIF45648.1 hypothetical protein X953_18830 [Virgibacillus sp. SK37]